MGLPVHIQHQLARRAFAEPGFERKRLITEVILYGTVGLARIGVGGGTLSVKKPDILQVCQAGSLLLCASLAWQVTSGYEETEFSGGWLTDPL